jgi:hypothetical protein
MKRWKAVVGAGFLTLSFLNLPHAVAATVNYSFTNATATGANGPTQSNVNAAYSGTSLASSVTVVGGFQKWTVPTTGTYTFTVAGAAGGPSSAATSYRGGRGAVVTATKSLTQGQVLTILVGQSGDGSGSSGAGGGASFVSFDTSTSTNLIVAGGGGGLRCNTSSNAGDADTSTAGSGKAPSSYNGVPTSWVSNTVAGSFGTSNTIAFPLLGTISSAYTTLGYGAPAAYGSNGDGGAGWNGNGFDDSYGSTVAQKLSGSATGGSTSSASVGGFGGGASGAGNSCGGGGGGGYTGGNGGAAAGGGGTWVDGFTSVSVALDTRTFYGGGTPVHGYVTISLPAQVAGFAFGATSYNGLYRQNLTVTATLTFPVTGGDGKVVFYANKKRIPGCQAIQSVNNVATCTFKPSLHGAIAITATWIPTNPAYDPSTSGPVPAFITKRTNTR